MLASFVLLSLRAVLPLRTHEPHLATGSSVPCRVVYQACDRRLQHCADGSRVGRSSDVWSLGIILYEIIVGHPPFAHCKNICQKITAITSGAIQWPKCSNPYALEVMKLCLSRTPEKRPSIGDLLAHPFLSSRAAKVAADAHAKVRRGLPSRVHPGRV